MANKSFYNVSIGGTPSARLFSSKVEAERFAAERRKVYGGSVPILAYRVSAAYARKYF